uniref:Uncharacterized protein AlNc14C56G4258 n=1 Tax=Albugo laibachii Nc14 TaxID=890382 RepID=F0WC75_9STRA|nr:conserved hypothetical protein [Albugo laibachii Nc14]|eukprot:CCA18788.1 conserved hypothetical protein [Albugo laibachii Nc14]
MDPNGMNPMMQQMSMPISMPMGVPNTGNPGMTANMQMGMGINPMTGMQHQSGRYNVHSGAQGQMIPPNANQQRQQQHIMMNSMNMNPAMMNMNMKMNSMGQQHPMGNANTNPGAMNVPNMGMGSVPVQNLGGADWRIQVTREHRANLIAKLYNEMVRLSTDPPPGIKLWMNVAGYELQLYKDASTQEEYIRKIFNRLKHLRQQPTDPTAAMMMQNLPNGGTLSRLDFSCYSNNMNPFNPRSGPQGMMGMQPHGAYGGSQYPGQTPAHGKSQLPVAMSSQTMPSTGKDTLTPRMQSGGNGSSADVAAEYWRQHDAMKAKYRDDVEKVHNAFKKYVDHMKDQDETDQKKKLRYLLSYVQLCANVLNEDKSTHQSRKLEELGRVYKYIVKIVNPYLKKLRSETDKRVHPSGTGISVTDQNINGLGMVNITGNGGQLSQQGQQPQTTQAQQNHQYQQQLQQQRQQQMQQQRLQIQRQQQQQQQMQMQRQQLLQHKSQSASQQSSQASHAMRNSSTSQSQQQNTANQQSSSSPTSNGNSQSQNPQQFSASKSSSASNRQSESPSLSTAFSLGMSDDNPYYSNMDSSLLQMPSSLSTSNTSTSNTNSGTTNAPNNSSGSLINYSMNFSNDLSPTGFSNSADLEFLDIDGTGLNYDGPDNSSNTSASQSQYHNTCSTSATSGGANGSSNANSVNSTENDTSHNDDNGDNSDLMTFVEAL